jgi:hypothetical protein
MHLKNSAGWKAVRMIGGRLMYTRMTNGIVSRSVPKAFGIGGNPFRRTFGAWLLVGNTLHMLYTPVRP